MSGALVRAVSAQSTTGFQLFIFDCSLSSILLQSPSQGTRRDRILQMCLKSRKDKQNICRQFWPGGVAVFAPTCLCYCSSWAKGRAQTIPFHNKGLCHPQSAPGHLSKDSKAQSCSIPGFACLYPTWKGLQENTWPSLKWFYFFSGGW